MTNGTAPTANGRTVALMADLEKVIRGWERCHECSMHPPGLSDAWVKCEYTIGLYCARDKLICETLEVLKEQNGIVRCKDCKHSIPSSEKFVVCTAPCNQMAHTTYKPIDWYCADGERKDGEKDGTDDTRDDS